jgi:hypothetical protein
MATVALDKSLDDYEMRCARCGQNWWHIIVDTKDRNNDSKASLLLLSSTSTVPCVMYQSCDGITRAPFRFSYFPWYIEARKRYRYRLRELRKQYYRLIIRVSKTTKAPKATNPSSSSGTMKYFSHVMRKDIEVGCDNHKQLMTLESEIQSLIRTGVAIPLDKQLWDACTSVDMPRVIRLLTIAIAAIKSNDPKSSAPFSMQLALSFNGSGGESYLHHLFQSFSTLRSNPRHGRRGRSRHNIEPPDHQVLKTRFEQALRMMIQLINLTSPSATPATTTTTTAPTTISKQMKSHSHSIVSNDRANLLSHLTRYAESSSQIRFVMTSLPWLIPSSIQHSPSLALVALYHRCGYVHTRSSPLRLEGDERCHVSAFSDTDIAFIADSIILQGGVSPFKIRAIDHVGALASVHAIVTLVFVYFHTLCGFLGRLRMEIAIC